MPSDNRPAAHGRWPAGCGVAGVTCVGSGPDRKIRAAAQTALSAVELRVHRDGGLEQLRHRTPGLRHVRQLLEFRVSGARNLRIDAQVDFRDLEAIPDLVQRYRAFVLM
jgi:hypothetical protein